MSGERISLIEFDRYEQGVKATMKRIQAENTWLRHNFDELEKRVAQLKKDVTALRTAATRMRKSQATATAQNTPTRSSK